MYEGLPGTNMLVIKPNKITDTHEHSSRENMNLSHCGLNPSPAPHGGNCSEFRTSLSIAFKNGCFNTTVCTIHCLALPVLGIHPFLVMYVVNIFSQLMPCLLTCYGVF